MDALPRHRFALIFILFAATSIFLGPLLRREVFTFRDHSDYFQPLRYTTAEHLRRGVLPLWNPYSASGEPWLANPQTGVFYPPAWLLVVFPFETAYMLFLLVHLLILGWGGYLLFTRFTDRGAALVGGVALMFCGPTLSLLDVSNNLATFAWIPLVLFCALERTAEARLPRAVDAAVLALAFLGGEPYFAALAAAMYAGIVIALGCGGLPPLSVDAEKAARSPKLRAVREVILVGLFAFALAAVQLLPFLEILRGSDRAAGLSSEEIFRESMKPADWVRMAVPPSLEASGYDAKLSQHFIPIIYCGMVVGALAFLAAVAARDRKRRRSIVAWLALLVIAVLIAAGRFLPPVAAILTALPVSLFRYPARMVPIGALAVIALATIGWNAVRPKRRWADLLIVLLVIVDLLPRATPLLASARLRIDRIPYDRSIGRMAKIVRFPGRNGGAVVARNREGWISGYLNLYGKRFDLSTAAPLVSARYMKLHDMAVVGRRMDLLQFLSVAYLIADRPIPGLDPVGRSPGAVMHQLPRVMPMAMFWSHAQSAPSEEEAFTPLLQGNSPALLITPGLDASLAEAPPVTIPAETLAFDPWHAHITVTAPARGVVVLSQTDAPGWSVRVDDVARPKLLAHGIFRAVEVGAGKHRIVWTYRPLSLMVGAMMTVFGMTLLFVNLARFVKHSRMKNFSSFHARGQ